MVSLPKILGTLAPPWVLSPPPPSFLVSFWLLLLASGLVRGPPSPPEMTSCVFTWKSPYDIHHPLEYSYLVKEVGRWRKWLGRCWESRGRSQACVCLLDALHLLCTKLWVTLGWEQGEAQGIRIVTSRWEHNVPCQFVKKTSGGSSVHGGKTKKAEMDQAGKDGRAQWCWISFQG